MLAIRRALGPESCKACSSLATSGCTVNSVPAEPPSCKSYAVLYSVSWPCSLGTSLMYKAGQAEGRSKIGVPHPADGHCSLNQPQIKTKVHAVVRVVGNDETCIAMVCGAMKQMLQMSKVWGCCCMSIASSAHHNLAAGSR
jgi:hypothetical protein